jgi:hypothetical protein
MIFPHERDDPKRAFDRASAPAIRASLGTLLVSQESEPRKTESNIEVVPWQHFLELLWSGELGV